MLWLKFCSYTKNYNYIQTTKLSDKAMSRLKEKNIAKNQKSIKIVIVIFFCVITFLPCCLPSVVFVYHVPIPLHFILAAKYYILFTKRTNNETKYSTS